jgi:Na+-transporting methylmalonyl-CoA/oxaloacetate decarboxylase gamma subunit
MDKAAHVAALSSTLSSTQHTLWLTGIIVGFVVVAAVAALLTLLIILVKIIDRRVVQIRETLKAAEANTEATSLLPTVAGGVEAVLAEGLQHHLFLGRVLGKVRS